MSQWFIQHPYLILRVTSIDSDCCRLPTVSVISNKADISCSKKVFCEKVESSTVSPTIDDTDRKGSNNSSKVSSCEQTESDAPSYTINDITKETKSLKVSSCEQTTNNALSYTTNDTDKKRRISSEDLNNLDKGSDETYQVHIKIGETGFPLKSRYRPH